MGDDSDHSVAGRFHEVALRYGNGPEVLRGVSLELVAGSFHFLLGPSGAGKTSLVRMLSLTMKPTRGHLHLFGCDVATASRPALAALRRRIGVVFQDFRLLPQLSVRDNIVLPLIIAGVEEERVRLDSELLLARMGLDRIADTLPSSLSGGQQQLVAIARALIVRPKLLIADEPTANVDEALALRLIAIFHEINLLGTAVIIATHNERLANCLPYPRLRLKEGRVIEDNMLSTPLPMNEAQPHGSQKTPV